MNQCCTACKNVLVSETSSTKLRCGLSYFSTPAKDRRMQRMDSYPEVLSDGFCEEFGLATVTLLDADDIKQ